MDIAKADLRQFGSCASAT